MMNKKILRQQIIITETDKIHEHKCYWLNQKGGPCPWNSTLPENNYCKRHSIYEGVYTKEDIPSLIKCSGCKNLFKSNIVQKQCDNCHKRNEIIRKQENKEKLEHNIICKGLTQKGTQCTFEANKDDEYCEKHQTYKKWKDITNSGKNVCNNWIRGCWELIVSESKTCSKCRKTKQENENINNCKKRELAIEFNKINDNQKMCHVCNLIDLVKNITNNKCLACFNSYHKSELNRNKVDCSIRKLAEYKSKCNNKQKNNVKFEWELTDEEACKLFKQKCHYCNKLININGIDRIDSNKAYTTNNCVSCCKICNVMKNTYSGQEFIDIVIYILTANFYIDEILNNNVLKLFKYGENALYSKFKYECADRKIHNGINKIIYNNIITKSCNYCKNNFVNGARGIDRIDSTIGYIPGNIVPCCYTCNIMKNILSVNNFFAHLKSIYDYKIKKIITNDKTIKEQILSMCKNIKPFEPIHLTF